MRGLLPLMLGTGALLVFQGLTGARSHRPRRANNSMRLLLDEAGMTRLPLVRFLVLCVVSGTLATLVVAAFTSSLLVGLLFGGAATWLPIAAAKSRRAQRRRRFRESWPDAIATLISGVRAGMSLPEACMALTERGPVDLRSGFEAFSGTYRSTGSLVAGLERLRTELSDPIADRVVVALEMAYEVGGTDLVRVLRTLGNFVREELRIRKEIEARWSWTVSAARVATAAPWLILLLMSTRPEAAAAYSSPSGLTVIVVGAVCTTLGYRLMLRAARLPEQQRIGT